MSRFTASVMPYRGVLECEARRVASDSQSKLAGSVPCRNVSVRGVFIKGNLAAVINCVRLVYGQQRRAYNASSRAVG